MYMFSRSVRLAPGNPREQIDWALHMTEKVNQISDLRIQLWTSLFSPAAGTLAWTVVCSDLQDLENIEGKMMLDDGYLGLVEHGGRYVTGEGLTDGLVHLAYSDPDAATIAATAGYAVLTRMVTAPGCLEQVMEVGPAAAQRIAQATGAPTSFGVELTGEYGAVGFMALFETLRAVQAAGEAIRSDSEFTKFVDQSSPLVRAGTTTQTIWRKLA